ncbi:HD domain-containing protein [Propioniciclava sp. MC1683]|nr:HD domain-containing protein [Propioniciclava sp. MC1683]
MTVPTPEQVATDAHAGQVDKAGLPYIEHPRRVAARVAAQTADPDALAAAWLHDVVEDTAVGLDELRQLGFNERVLDAVDALTRRPGEGDAYYRRVAANPIALMVKRADIADNTDPVRMQRLTSEEVEWFRHKYDHALRLLARSSR